MSMYSQSAYSSAPSYGGNFAGPSYPASSASSSGYHGAYSAPPPPPPPAYYQPPPPTRQETQIFRDWFAQQISGLVENNRSIIHRLAFIAREHADRFADVISQCLEAHIRRVHPAIKLPAWYLLDSVSKNLGHPYTQLFSGFVAPLFLECFDHVDDATRSKMEEMLVTWRTGGPGGAELFGRNVQNTLEGAIWSGPSSSSGPSRNQVLMELDVILTLKTRAVEQNPNDRDARTQMDALHQLRAVVLQDSVSQASLISILDRLRTLARNTASSAPPPVSMPPPPTVGPSTSFSPPPPAFPSNDAISSALSSLMALAPAQPVVPPAPVPSAPAIPDVMDLYNRLMATGVLNSVAAGASATRSAPADDDDSPKFEPIVEPKPALTDAKLVAMREYENRILSLSVSTTASGLQRPQPAMLSILYDDMPLKCAQCARRFADNEAGRQARDNHLDLHFRQNKRASQSSGRGHTRSWFVGVQDWVSEQSSATVDEKGKGKADPPPNSAKAIAAAAVERDMKLRKMTVNVPPGEESKNVTCPICKETIQTEFNEEDEEWVWRNAIRAKTKVYHATCHADALASQTAARLLRDQTNRASTPISSQPQSPSRSRTPEPITPGVAGKGAAKTPSPLRRDRTLSPPGASLAVSLKRKSPSRDDADGIVTAIGTPSSTLLNIPEESSESTVEGDQSQPNKRARTSPPPPTADVAPTP